MRGLMSVGRLTFGGRRATRALRRLVRHAGGAAGPTVGYVTDVEGNLDFWRRFVLRSAVIHPPDAADRELLDLSLRPGCHLVFGGDSVDKSPGDLRFLRSLLSLKERNPDRVHLLLGNRDINKMRLAAELSERHWLEAVDHPGVYWRHGTTPAAWLAEQPTETLREDTRANRLRYMLQDTMGSPKAFEFRRCELRAMRGVGAPAAEVSDDEVLKSYRESLAPGGLMRRYLQQAQLAALVGPALYVHGAVGRDSMGVVPRLAPHGEGSGRLALQPWVAALNAFAAQQVEPG